MTRSRPCSGSATLRRPKPSRARLVALVLASALGVAGAEARIAPLIAGARDAAALGYADAAMELVAEALSFAPASSDALYLDALLRLSRGAPPFEVIAGLEAALASASFRLYGVEEARLLYASMLAGARRPAETLRILSSLPESAEARYAETIARLALGDDVGASRAAVGSMRRYPLDARPALAVLANAKGPALDSVAELARAGLPLLRELSPGLLPLLAELEPSPEEARLLLREYRAAGHASPRATVLALRLGLIAEARAIAEMVSGAYAPTREALERLYGLLASDDARLAFAAALAAYSGPIHDGLGPDGRPDALTVYASGKPARWALDADRDGRAELEIVFSEGAPRTLVRRTAHGSLELRYRAWPELELATFRDDSGERSYSLAPGVASYRGVALRGFPGLGREPVLVVAAGPEAALSESYVATRAYAARRIVASSGPKGAAGVTLTETALLGEGAPFASYWRDSRGLSGSSRYGLDPLRLDIIDSNGDGRYDARRVWRLGADGRLVVAYTEHDTDGDGVFEYRETSDEGRLLRSWDYDADGSVDLTLEEDSGGLSRYRFYGGPRGLVEASFRNGRLVEAYENGRPSPVTMEAGGLVAWIGRKPFDLGPERPRDGYGMRGGVPYRVLSIGGISYVQVLE